VRCVSGSLRCCPPTTGRDRITDASATLDPGRATASGIDERAERLADRLAVPALVAAFASIPAVFLTLADGTLATTGRVIDLASATVLLVEGAIPLLIARDKRDWIRRHRWLLLVVALVIPAVVLAAGPAQLLRLARSVGALRVLRVRRIVRAGKVATSRLELSHRGRRLTIGAATLFASAFVAVVLADPTSSVGGVARTAVDTVGPVGVIGAGVVLAAATFILVRDRRERSG
jgi:CsoR family transcriptional regulator, copper-sensing transcriptional repressor